MKKFRWFLLVISVFTSQSSVAQHKLNLQQCLELGLKNTPEFQIKQLDILSAEAMQRSAILEYLPLVNLDGSHTYNIGSVIDPATNNRVSSRIQSDNIGLSAQINILNLSAFTSARRTKIASLKAKSDKEVTAAEYSLTVLDNYVNVLYTQELLKIQQDQFKNAIFNLNRISKEVELGKLPKSNFYDMYTSYLQEESTMLQTQQLLYNQKLILLQLLNDPENKPEDIILDNIPSGTLTELPTMGQVLEKSLVTSPAVRGATFKQEFMEKDIVLQRHNFLPLISAFYNYSSFYYLPLNQQRTKNIATFWTQISDNKNHYVGLQLSIPVFGGLKTRRDVRLSKLEYQKTKVELEQEKNKVRQLVEQETAKRLQNIELAAKLEFTRASSEKSFSTTQLKFSSGLVDATLFTSSKNQLLFAEYNLLKANITAAHASLKLHFLQYNRFP